MAPVKIHPGTIREFADPASFYAWLASNHRSKDEIWIKIHKVNSGLKSITPREAIDVVLCWGWIDGLRKGFDDRSYLQRYSPRTKKGTWSRINVDNVARLIKGGRMTEHGLAQVDAAKADGRWYRAYASGKDMEIPDDLRAAIDAVPRAKEMLGKLSAQNRFALAFRTHNMKTEAGRKKKIETFVAMLKRGETIHPQGKKGLKVTARKSMKSATGKGESPSRLIDARIRELDDWRGETLSRVRALIKQADPEVVEEWKWRGVPVWSHDGMICTGESYRSAVKLTFAKGASLEDPTGLFNASLDGNARRAIDLHEGDKIDEKALKALIRAAVVLNTSVRAAAARKKPKSA